MQRVRLGAFLLSMMSFALPFMTVSCPGVQRDVTGIELVTGVTIDEPQMLGPVQQRRVSGDPLAVTLLVAIVLGAVASLARGRPAGRMAIALGMGGTAMLLLLRQRIDASLQSETMGMVHVTYQSGFWLSLACLVAVVLSGLTWAGTARLPQPLERPQ